METGRREHACTLYKDGILVTGSSPDEGFLDSQIRMEFLNLTSMQWEKDVVPSLNKHVLTPKMDIINGETVANLFIIPNYLFIKNPFFYTESLPHIVLLELERHRVCMVVKICF